MAFARRGSISDVSFSDRLTERLGGLVLKDKQEEALKSLLDGKDVFAVLPAGFGKSLIYQSFVIAKEIDGCVTDPCSCPASHHSRRGTTAKVFYFSRLLSRFDTLPQVRLGTSENQDGRY